MQYAFAQRRRFFYFFVRLGFGVFLIDNAGAYAIMIFEEDCGMNGPALAPHCIVERSFPWL